jgi:hypothetical protein
MIPISNWSLERKQNMIPRMIECYSVCIKLSEHYKILQTHLNLIFQMA